MMRYIFIAAVAALVSLSSVNVASAWDAANCRAKCKATSNAPDAYDGCVAKWNCDHFQGKRESDARVKTGADKWNSEHAK
jgi:hypothetical protein